MYTCTNVYTTYKKKNSCPVRTKVVKKKVGYTPVCTLEG